MISLATARELREIHGFLRHRLFERSREQPPPGTLYHYTDSNGLLGIIKNRALWATHFQYLNDSSEFIYAHGLMKEVVANAAEGAPGSSKARLRHRILEDRDELEDRDKNEDNLFEEEQFVMCFSERGDLLS